MICTWQNMTRRCLRGAVLVTLCWDVTMSQHSKPSLTIIFNFLSMMLPVQRRAKFSNFLKRSLSLSTGVNYLSNIQKILLIIFIIITMLNNSQMASTTGEGNGVGERWVKKRRRLKVQWMEHGESSWLRWNGRKEETSDYTKLCWSFFQSAEEAREFLNNDKDTEHFK